MLERAIAKGGMSVRLSVTLVSHAHTVQDVEMFFTPYDTAMFLSVVVKFRSPDFRGSPRTSVLKRGTSLPLFTDRVVLQIAPPCEFRL